VEMNLPASLPEDLPKIGTEGASLPVLTYSPHPFLASKDRQLIYVPYVEGETIGRYLDRVGIRVIDNADTVLMVNGQHVSRELWYMAKPKSGTTITLRIVPAGGDSNPIAAIAMIALAIFAPGIGQLGVGFLTSSAGLGISFSAGMGTLVAGVITGAVVMVGGMIINALFAPPTQQLQDARAPESVSQNYSLSGGSNQPRYYGPLPLILGEHRVFPDLTSKPYTENFSDDQFLIQLFNFGYAKHGMTLSNFKVGENPLTNYVEYISEESGPSGVLYKFPGNVDTVAGGVLGSGSPPVQYPTATDDTAFVARTSGTNAIRLAIDLEGTIYRVDSEGMGEWFVSVWVVYRNVLSGGWIVWPGFEGGRYISNNNTKPLRLTFYTDPLAPGQYEVKVKRVLGEGDPWEQTQVSDAMTWTALRTYQLDPASYEGQYRYGMWIKATAQLNGVLNRVSCLAQITIPTWNGSTWVNAISSNCAWVFLYFARGGKTAAGRPLWGCQLPDSQIDIEGLKLWGAYCTAHGLTYNTVIDTPMSQHDVLNSIARSGRGSLSWHTGKLGVIWDSSETPVTAQFGMGSIKPRTFEIEWATGETAEEIVVQFVDKYADYNQSEVRVLAPGVSVPLTTQTVSWRGCDNEFLAGQYANLLMANNVYRNRSIRWETDAEGLVVTRGDVIQTSHDLTQWGYSGRLPSANVNVAGQFPAWTVLTGTTLYLAAGVGPDDISQVYHVSDTSGTQYGQIQGPLTGVSGTVEYRAHYRVKVDTVQTRFPSLRINFTGGTAKTYEVRLNTQTGEIRYQQNTSAANAGVQLDNGYWWVWIVGAANGTNTSVGGVIYPAPVSTLAGTDNVAVTGSIDVSMPELFRTDQIVLDRLVPLLTGQTSWAALVHPDGGESYHQIAPATDGWYDILTLAAPLGVGHRPGIDFPDSPIFDWKWRTDFASVPGKRLKIAAIEPSSERQVRIICVDDPAEYHLMSVLGYQYVAKPVTQPTTPTVYNLVLAETMVKVGTIISTHVVAVWTTIGDTETTRVRWHASDNVWVQLGDVAGNRVEFPVSDGETITVEVTVYNALGMIGTNSKATASINVLGKQAKPPVPQVFLVAGQGDGTRQLTFGYSTITPPVDLLGFRIRYISGSSGSWNTMTPLHTGVLSTSPYEFNFLAAGTWTFAVRAVDTSNNESNGELFATAVLLDPRMGGVLFMVDPFSLSWPGTKTSCWRDLHTGWLEANSTQTWANLGAWSTFTQWTSNPVTSFVYQHTTIDVGVVTSFTPNASCIGVGSFLVEEQHSDDNNTYSSWATAGVKISGRYLRVRVTATPTVGGQIMHLESMQIVLDAKTIQEWINDSVVQPAGWTKVATGKYRVPITNTYAVIQQVSISFQSATEAGWTYTVLDKNTTSGPQIQFNNPSGTAADPSGTVDVYVKGL
jgi:predicted phage tail protein